MELPSSRTLSMPSSEIRIRGVPTNLCIDVDAALPWNCFFPKLYLNTRQVDLPTGVVITASSIRLISSEFDLVNVGQAMDLTIECSAAFQMLGFNLTGALHYTQSIESPSCGNKHFTATATIGRDGHRFKQEELKLC